MKYTVSYNDQGKIIQIYVTFPDGSAIRVNDETIWIEPGAAKMIAAIQHGYGVKIVSVPQ